MLGECRSRDAKYAVVVLKSFPSLAAGVGHDPKPLPLVIGSCVSCRYALPLRIEPDFGQGPENVSEAANKEPWDVLHEQAALQLASKPHGLLVKTCALSVRAKANDVGNRCVLAWESGANKVDWKEVFEFPAVEESDIPKARCQAPMCFKHGATMTVDLTEGDRSESACSFESKAESADAAE